MDESLHFYVVDDDPLILRLVKTLLEDAGHRVSCADSSDNAVSHIQTEQPDCVLTDIMMPGIDGFELCRRLRDIPELETTKIIVMSVKHYQFDRQRARSLGADGYILKPINLSTFLDEVTQMLIDCVTLSYWGVRGTVPVPGKKTLKYGGNTPCVTLSLPKDRLFIFDAGTGIRELSNYLMSKVNEPLSAKLFLSHPHWDHIQGLPFFSPLYIPGNEFEICGASHSGLSVRALVSGQMEGVYFPISIRKFGANVFFRDLSEGSFELDSISIQTMLLSHPGNCLGYRVDYHGKRFCYVTDNELFTPDLPQYSSAYIARLTEFVRQADILITDAAYTDEEYPAKVEYGHSCISEVVKLAHNAEVRELHLFHHDPDQTDNDIDQKYCRANDMLKSLGSETVCLVPAEGQSFRF